MANMDLSNLTELDFPDGSFTGGYGVGFGDHFMENTTFNAGVHIVNAPIQV